MKACCESCRGLNDAAGVAEANKPCETGDAAEVSANSPLVVGDVAAAGAGEELVPKKESLLPWAGAGAGTGAATGAENEKPPLPLDGCTALCSPKLTTTPC